MSGDLAGGACWWVGVNRSAREASSTSRYGWLTLTIVTSRSPLMKTVERLALLPSSPGTARHIAIHRYGGGSGPKVYVQASLHANELPAMLVAQHLIGLLDDAQAEGRITGDIVVVPVANPIGLGQGVDGVHLGRYELATGQNFNRGFFDHAVALAERVKRRLGTDAAGNVGLIRREWAALVAERTPSSELCQPAAASDVTRARGRYRARSAFRRRCADASLCRCADLARRRRSRGPG